MTSLIFQSAKNPSLDLVFEPPDYIEMGDYDLAFGTAPTDDYNLVFGAAAKDGATLPPITGVLNLELLLPSLRLQALSIKDLYGADLILRPPELLMDALGEYDVNTFTGFSIRAGQGFSDTAPLKVLATSATRDASAIHNAFTSRYQNAEPLKVLTTASSQEAYSVSRQVVTFYEVGQPVKEYRYTAFEEAERVSRSNTQPFQRAESVPLLVKGVRHQEGEGDSRSFKADWQRAVPLSRKYGFKVHYSQQVNKSFETFYQQAEPPINVAPPVVPPIEVPEPVLPTDFDIIFDCLPSKEERLSRNYDITFNNCWKTKPPISVDYTEPYFVLNTIELINLATGEAIQATNIDFSTDIDSFAWSGSLTVSSEEMPKLTSPTNKPVKVSLTFNGNVAVFMVQKISRTVSFNKSAYKVEIISPTALLDSPFSRVDSMTVMSDMAPQALIEERLQTNLTGLVLDWQYLPPLDWVVAANTFSYQELSPIKAIGKLLEGSAAFIYSDLDGVTVRVKRRRSFEFWETASNPKLIDSALLTSLSFSQEKHRNFDAVYVISGLNQTLGITAHVVRDEYQGSELAPQVIAPTLTSPSAVRDAGKFALGKAGVVETRTLNQPIVEDNYLLKPADTVSFIQDGTTYIGTVLSTGISIKFNSMYQNFVVEVIKGFS